MHNGKGQESPICDADSDGAVVHGNLDEEERMNADNADDENDAEDHVIIALLWQFVSRIKILRIGVPFVCLLHVLLHLIASTHIQIF